MADILLITPEELFEIGDGFKNSSNDLEKAYNTLYNAVSELSRWDEDPENIYNIQERICFMEIYSGIHKSISRKLMIMEDFIDNLLHAHEHLPARENPIKGQVDLLDEGLSPFS